MAKEVSRMAYEILKNIVEAEERAIRMKKDAAAEAEKIKADAIKQRELLFEEAKRQGEKERQEAVAAASAQSREIIQKIAQEAEAACDSLKAQAALKKEDAVEAVMRKVVGEYGSC